MKKVRCLIRDGLGRPRAAGSRDPAAGQLGWLGWDAWVSTRRPFQPRSRGRDSQPRLPEAKPRMG